jgi:N-methylhydantoinase A
LEADKLLVQLRVGIDVGGTFTDIVVLDPNEGKLVHGKSLTTPRKPVV